MCSPTSIQCISAGTLLLHNSEDGIHEQQKVFVSGPLLFRSRCVTFTPRISFSSYHNHTTLHISTPTAQDFPT